MVIKKYIKSYKIDIIAVSVLIFLGTLHLFFTLRTDNFFSTDDFAVLSYIRDHNLLEITKNFLLEGDLFGFRKVIGYLYFEVLFEAFGVRAFYFNLGNFMIHTANLIILYFTAKKISGNRFASFVSSVIFNKIYLLYFSNVHELLVTLFSLLSIHFFLRNKRKTLSLMFFIFALLTKEIAFIIPFVLIALSIYKKTSLKKTTNHFLVLVVYGLYQLRFVLSKSVLPENESYAISYKLTDLTSGLFYYLSPLVLVVLATLPLISKRFRSYILLFTSLLALLPFLFLVGRREEYYLYLPMMLVALFIAVNLPRLSLKSILLSVVMIAVFGGRNVFPKIAWRRFPNWQKVSIGNVVDRVEDGVRSGDTKIYIGDINLERDAKLMLQNDLLGLFLEGDKLRGYHYEYFPEEGILKIDH
jgi:hypothetical protein